MKLIDWEKLKGLRQMFAPGRSQPVQKAARIVAMQLHIVFPAKVGLIAVVLYFLSNIGWFDNSPTPHTVALELLEELFVIYVACNAVAAVFFIFSRRFPGGLFLWLVFVLGLLDGLFMGGLVFRTGGFDSIAFWVFPGLIVLNALSIPLAMPQIVLNLLLSVFYASAGIFAANISDTQTAIQDFQKRPATNRPPAEFSPNPGQAATQAMAFPARPHRPLWPEPHALPDELEQDQTAVETVVLRVVLLWFLTVCCYAVQVLAERQRRLEEEAHEMGLRQGQLRSAGRIAAEFAHQIKNPLAIMNNAAFSLQRSIKDGRGDPARHLQIIQEEIERSDKIVTQLMGYAQLNEGRVEKLNLAHELSLAVAQVFPLAAEFPVKVECRCEPDLPPLLMQRNHLDEIFVNILQNARDAMGAGGGRVSAVARRLSENLIEVAISNTGPEIPADKLEKVFEAHYTTKEKGTGLGLAIVKHNVELYAGTVRAESKLGKGVRFVLVFPAKTEIDLK
ncbi:MAG: ATP-binding protein [Verrucomicrobiota bacterium]